MSLEVLAQNVRRLRNAKRFSQKALADAAGISLPAIKNLELGKNEPRVRTVQAIAKALDVKLQMLFLPVRELQTIRFRSARRMQNRENILAEVSRWLDDFNYLEKVLDEKVPFKLKKTIARCSRDRIVEAAELCRKDFDLGPDEPIYNICGLLENVGVKVLSLPKASDGFFGLSVGEQDGGPAVVVNVWERISVERRIFSAAHELGHLMLHRDAYDVTQTQENKEEEHEADLFAGHFLMPEAGFRKEWNKSYGLPWLDRIFKIKGIYRVSYKTILHRLSENQSSDTNRIWIMFQKAYQKKFNRKLSFKEEPMAIESSEPFGLHRFDFYEDRFRRLVRKAIEMDAISPSRGAEMIGMSIEEIQDLLNNWEAAP